MAVHTNSYLYSFTPFCLKMNQTVVSPLGMTQKSVVSPFSSFGKEEWSKTEVVGEIMFIPISL